jgi:hypothetical protein
LPSQCVIVRLSRAITVAGGVYAPGHVGELTQVVPFELVDAVLQQTGRVQQRLRALPSRVGVYLLLAMGLFEQVGLAGVWSRLVAGLGGLPVAAPSEKALRDLRRRLGPAPLRMLFEVLAGPLAQPHTPGTRYRRWRTVAFDGCSSLKVPDHERNRGLFGKPKARVGVCGYPMLRLITLVETGTRGMLGAAFGPLSVGECAYAARLLPLLGPGMLLLDDRGFDSDQFLADVAATGAQLLVRARSTRRPPIGARLPDGSYLTRIAGVPLRVIEARITLSGADGATHTGTYRLLSTLTDHRTDPATALIRLYHERWEIESAYLALRHTLLHGRVLRSKDPLGIEQEMWALLALYQALRTVMLSAAESVPGTDPDRASFSVAVHAARDSLINASGILPATTDQSMDPVGHIGRTILAALLPPRRPRFAARKVKSPISRYHTHTPTDTTRPPTSTRITATTITIHPPDPHTRWQPATSSTPPTPPSPPPPAVLNLLQSAPGHAWQARDLAKTLGITDPKALNSFRVRLSQWSHRGMLTKTGPATYTLPDTTP